MISLRQLEALVWVTRMGTFERAANKLNVTQSTVSKRINELEQIVGVSLFDRQGHSNKLTAEGEKLLALAESMLALQAQALDLKALSDTPARKLRLGVTELTAMTWLPRLIFALKTRFPKVAFEPTVAMTRELHQGLTEGSFDVVIAPESFAVPGSRVVRLADVRNAWVASPSLVPEGCYMSYEDLAALTIITQGKGSGSGFLVSSWLRSQAIDLPNQMTCDSLIALLGLTIGGVGASYIPVDCQRPLIKSGKLREIHMDPPLPSLPYSAFYMENQPTVLISEVVGVAKEVCDYKRLFR
ncbi:HTH-type transcriptional regulator ArgP [compost metagenome]